MTNEDEESISPSQEKYLLEIYFYIHKIVSRKLGRKHQSAVEDIKQRVFLKLWRWKRERTENDLTGEEWQKLAHTTAVNEVIDFFRKKDNSLIPFSQMKTEMETEVLTTESPDILIGNSSAEIHSMLALVWAASQELTLRQKYAYFLQFPDFIIEFITSGCCSIEELARFFEITERELLELIEQVPLSDESLTRKLSAKLGGAPIFPKQIWEARAKAKAKLAKSLSRCFINERLSVERRN